MGDMTTRTSDSDTDATHAAPGAVATSAPAATRPGNQAEYTWPSTTRKVAFRTFSVVLALFTLAYFVFGLLEVVIMWLPAEMLASFGDLDADYPGGLLVHRTHFMAIGLVAWTLVPAILVQLRKPWRRVASMLVTVVLGIAGSIAYALAGTMQAWITEDLVVTIPILVLAALHPRARDLARRPDFDPGMLRWAVIAAVPWTVYALLQARLQFLDRPGDVHAGIEHWATAFLLAVAVIATAVLGASDHDGWRLPAWTAVAVSAMFGLHSLVYPGSASGLPVIAAIGAIAWSGVYGRELVRRQRIGEPGDVTHAAGAGAGT